MYNPITLIILVKKPKTFQEILVLIELVMWYYATYYSVHTPCPCVFWPSRHNFRDIELKFCILSLLTYR